MISFYRIIKFALQDIGRNLGLSLMTVLILVLMLLSVNLLWSVKIIADKGAELLKNQINFSLYLKSNVTDKQLNDLTSYIKSFPEVTDLTTLKPPAVLSAFEKRNALRPDMLEALKELDENPFGPALVVKTQEPEQYKEILLALNVPEYESIIESKSFEGHESALERLQTITNRVESAGLGLSVFFMLISFLIIFNTIRVAIYTQRVEINIKRLVGANNWFIRGPYMLEALLFTLASLLISGGIIFAAFNKLDPYLNVAFTDGFSLTNYFSSHILYLATIEGGAVLLLTIMSSSLAMQKHLKT